jgi:hypothetical protein
MFGSLSFLVSEDLVCRDEVHEHTAGVSGNLHKKYKTFQQALSVYTDNYHSNRLRVVPVPGSRIWYLTVVPSSCSDEALWREVDDLLECFDQINLK